MSKLCLILLAVFGSLVFYACNSYRQVSVEKNTFYNDREIPDKIDRYNVYVHDGSNLYTLANSTFKHDTIRGTIQPLPANFVDAHPEKRSEIKAAKNDMHIYISKRVDDLVTVKDATATYKPVTIDRSSVERVDMFAKDERTGWQLVGLVAGIIVLGIFAAIAIIYASIAASANASAESNSGDSGSNSDSGDSGSGDSGGSNSGGSNSNSGGSGDSGSGGSGSGCYVATMVYGSYDAPNVLVLRSFRDQFLAHFGVGRSFINWYYANSPVFVEKYKHQVVLHRIIRVGLNLFVWLIRPAFRRFL